MVATDQRHVMDLKEARALRDHMVLDQLAVGICYTDLDRSIPCLAQFNWKQYEF